MKKELIDKFPGTAALEMIYEEHARDCTKCELHKTRKSVVFGVGNPERPDIAFLGEAPGKFEDEKGEPFVGPAGELLDKLIVKLGYKRADVYILNTIACRPPENRNPLPEETAACNDIMRAQLKAVRPRTIVCVGKVAANVLLKQNKDSMSELRNRWWIWDRIPVRVTYHTAFLLRKPDMRARTWKDMQEVMKRLKGTKEEFKLTIEGE